MTSQVGFLAYALDRAPTGIGRHTRELMDALVRAGVQLKILVAGRSDQREAAIGLPGAGLLPALLTLGQVEIAWAARRWHLALIHDPTGCVPLALAPACRVATIHDVIPYIHPRTSTALDWLIYRIWLPRVVPKLDAVLTDSQHSKQDILRYLPLRAEKVMVIPEAANPCFRPMGPGEIQPALARAGIDFPYILYVGAIEPRKNLIRLLQAYARLRKWSAHWRLVVVGARNFWKSSPVAETVEQLDLKSCVHFTGYIPEEDLPAIYNGADLFVFPSLYEGFGLPPLEAMACGTPVVTSNTSSLPEVVGDAALLVDPYDVDELASAMRLVLEDADLAASLSARGLARAGEFSWERTARETIAVYERVLGKKITD